MKTVVISQPMFFPWVGLLEQLSAADVYVHLDDAQFVRGYFNRVQIKTANGMKWLTAPLSEFTRGQRINEVRLNSEQDWRRSHLDFLRQAFAASPFKVDMLELVGTVYDKELESLAELSIASIDGVCKYFDLCSADMLRSSQLDVPGRSWERILAIVRMFHGDRYITGHGARHYLNHEAFEEAGVQVEYMDYSMTPYPQLYGPFTPYVSILDLIANLGPSGREVVHARTKPWRDFLTNG